MTKIRIKIRNSGFIKWVRSLPKHINLKFGYKSDFDPDEVTGERKRKEWLNKPKKN